jgi:methionyl aminopeptidase
MLQCFAYNSKRFPRSLPALFSARSFLVGNDFNFSGKVRPGVQSPKSIVPDHIAKPDYAADGIPQNAKRPGNLMNIPVHTDEDIARMRVAGRLAREVLDAAVQMVKVGVTTDEIDKLVHEETIKRNCYPSPLNYHGYPKSCCTSINEIICHGIPDSTVLQNGDIVNVDVTVFHDGVHGDCSETVFVGEVDAKTADLVKTTYESLQAAIAVCKPGTITSSR